MYVYVYVTGVCVFVQTEKHMETQTDKRNSQRKIEAAKDRQTDSFTQCLTYIPPRTDRQMVRWDLGS